MNRLLLGVSVAVLSSVPALAEGTTTAPDFTTLTSSVNWSTVVTAIMTIAAGLVGVYLAMAGAKLVLSMLRRA